MKKHLFAAVLTGLGILGVAFAEDGPKPPTHPPGRPGMCRGCMTARAASARGSVGYCEHCGILAVKVLPENLDKAKEALTKAGATEIKAQEKSGMITAKVAKEKLEDTKKAVAEFMKAPDKAPAPPETPAPGK